jgi:hypothetical protein
MISLVCPRHEEISADLCGCPTARLLLAAPRLLAVAELIEEHLQRGAPAAEGVALRAALKAAIANAHTTPPPLEKPTVNPRFVKIGVAGEELAPDAPEWIAVLDHETNLIWSRAVQKANNWQHADELAKSTTVAGVLGRLPTRKELLSLIDDTKYRPAIDTAFFPECPTDDWYWASTPAAPSPGDCAWFVNFYSGLADWVNRDLSGFVRAVRARQ